VPPYAPPWLFVHSHLSLSFSLGQLQQRVFLVRMSHGGAELALIVFLPESNVTNNKETKETNAEQRNE